MLSQLRRALLASLFVIASGATLLQTSCEVAAADAISGWSISVANQFIRTSLTELWELEGLSLGGF
jgi:hypothetical protein